jgi:tetratricopeptide (TPR) repeat protein
MPRQKLKWYDDQAKVGRRLRAAREAAGFSQRDLATTNCSAAYISRIEKGDRVPSLPLMRELASRLGVSEDYLAYGAQQGLATSGLAMADARVALRLGELDVSRELANAALSRAKSDSDRAAVSALLGEIDLAENDYRGAIDAIERARQLDASIEATAPDAADALGRAYARAGEFAASIAVFTRVRDAAAQRGDAINEVRFGTLLAYVYSDSANFVAAEETLAAALGAAEQLDDPLTRARTLWAQSRLRAMQNDADTAAQYAERALAILEVGNYDYYTGLAHQLLAHIELDRGNGDRAIELLEKATPLIEASGRKFDLARLQIERARALSSVGRRDEAASGAMAASAAIAGDLSIDAARCYLVVADVYRELEEFERATELYELAVELLQPTPNRYLVEAYSKLAELLEERGNKEQALEVLKAAMKVQVDAERMLTSH